MAPLFTAARAWLVDEIVEVEDVAERGWPLAVDLAQGPTPAFAEMKRLLAQPGLSEHLQQEVDTTCAARTGRPTITSRALPRSASADRQPSVAAPPAVAVLRPQGCS
jgi:hypothetical protein